MVEGETWLVRNTFAVKMNASTATKIRHLYFSLYNKNKQLFEQYFQNAIITSDLPMIKHLFESMGIAAPFKALVWVANSKNVKQELVDLIMENMLKNLNKVKLIMDKLKKQLSIDNDNDEYELNLVLNQQNLKCNSYEKNFLIELLSITGKQRTLMELQLQHHHFIHDAVCEAAFYANCEFIEKVFHYLNTNHSAYIFQPKAVCERRDIFRWLEENIKRAERGEPVGWRCGPDSGTWPSTKPQDYIDTYNLLKSVSIMEY